MDDPVGDEQPRRRLPLRSTVVASLVTAVVVGVGAFLLGHHLGEDDARPHADFIRQQQADVIARFERTTRRLIEIEQSSIALLEGKSGAQVDLEAYYKFHTNYTQVYDVVLGQMGRVNSLFGSAVRTDAKAVSHSDDVVLELLFPDRTDLLRMDARQIRALIGNSHAARKSQWQAIRRFQVEATEEMLHSG